MLIRKFPKEDEFRSLGRVHNVIPVCAEILADTETPVSLLRKIYTGDGPAFLLESVEGGERWGRYSFLSASARWQILVFQNHVEIRGVDSKEEISHDGDPLSILKKFMNQFQPAPIKGLPRFWGGGWWDI